MENSLVISHKTMVCFRNTIQQLHPRNWVTEMNIYVHTKILKTLTGNNSNILQQVTKQTAVYERSRTPLSTKRE